MIFYKNPEIVYFSCGTIDTKGSNSPQDDEGEKGKNENVRSVLPIYPDQKKKKNREKLFFFGKTGK